MKNNILVTQSSLPEFEEYCDEIKKMWETHWLTNMGEEHKQFQKELECFLDCPHVILYTNGHLALENIIEAMEFPKGAEVITTPFTFASTTHAIVRNGLEPIFCDINENDYTIDVEKIEALITSKTVAIIPVHVYGNVCNIEEIKRIADKYHLKVIYDAAHAFGVKYKGVSVSNFGDATMFSFHATKVFHTIEGGAVCFAQDELIQVLNDLKNFGIRNAESVAFVGGNAKMSEFQAAMGICNLRHINEEISKRKAIVDRYELHLANIDGIRIGKKNPDVEYNYAYFPVIFDKELFGADRDEIFEVLAAHGIGARKYFYPLTNMFAAFHGKYDVYQTPIALQISKNVLTLPLYSELAIEDVDRICEIIIKCGHC